MNTKIIVSAVAAAILVAVAVGAYMYLPGMLPGSNSPVVADKPAIVGGLIGIGSTTITIKSGEGTEMTFEISAKTPVYSQVGDGELGRIYNQFTVGDVLSVIAQKNKAGVAKQIEIIPLSTSTPAGATLATLAGTIVEISDDRITVRPLSNDPLMQITESRATFTVTPATTYVTKVLGGQVGKPIEAFTVGATVVITSHSEAPKVAQVISLQP